jgi:hypothetical protein
MDTGYARISTLDQHPVLELDALHGVDDPLQGMNRLAQVI